jgi:CDP-glucose 4,6-dehydratase
MEKSAGEAFNLATEDRFTVLEMTNIISGLMNSTLQPVIKDETVNEITDQYLGVEKVRKVLGWKPRYSIEEALTETIEWYRQNISFS